MKTFSEEQMNNVMSSEMKRFCALKEIIELAQNYTHTNSLDTIGKIKQTAKDAIK